MPDHRPTDYQPNDWGTVFKATVSNSKTWLAQATSTLSTNPLKAQAEAAIAQAYEVRAIRLILQAKD